MSDTSRLGAVLDSLTATITSRRGADPGSSYTARLLDGHEDKLLKKIAEEAGEVIMAAKDDDADHLRYEAADLLYHLLVVLERWEVSPEALADELESRFK